MMRRKRIFLIILLSILLVAISANLIITKQALAKKEGIATAQAKYIPDLNVGAIIDFQDNWVGSGVANYNLQIKKQTENSFNFVFYTDIKLLEGDSVREKNRAKFSLDNREISFNLEDNIIKVKDSNNEFDGIYLRKDFYEKTRNITIDKIGVENTLVVKMVGDDLIHNTVFEAAKTTDKYDFDMLFKNVKSDIKNSDISIINQETILIDEPKYYSGYPTFGSPEYVADAIVKAGFDIVCHATNHAYDKGVTGINNTLQYWREKYPNIKILGIHESANDSDITYITKNNIKTAFVNYTYGLNGFILPEDKKYMVDLLDNKEEIAKTMSVAKENSDMVIAILHIGNEYKYTPSAYHKEYVDFFIDSGADVVLCAHPHVLEPFGEIETQKGNKALVYYSLGNFVSAQDQVPRILGGMAEFVAKKDKEGKISIESFSLVPLVTHYDENYFTAYKLSDYTDELAGKHDISQKRDVSRSILWNLAYKILK